MSLPSRKTGRMYIFIMRINKSTMGFSQETTQSFIHYLAETLVISYGYSLARAMRTRAHTVLACAILRWFLVQA